MTRRITWAITPEDLTVDYFTEEPVRSGRTRRAKTVDTEELLYED